MPGGPLAQGRDAQLHSLSAMPGGPLAQGRDAQLHSLSAMPGGPLAQGRDAQLHSLGAMPGGPGPCGPCGPWPPGTGVTKQGERPASVVIHAPGLHPTHSSAATRAWPLEQWCRACVMAEGGDGTRREACILLIPYSCTPGGQGRARLHQGGALRLQVTCPHQAIPWLAHPLRHPMVCSPPEASHGLLTP
jgi:hypothetical protein